MNVTVIGTFLCLAGGALPQLDQEKWLCRKMNEKVPGGGAPEHKTIISTQGNGHRHVMIVRSNGRGLNLENLATGELAIHRSPLPCLLLLIICWLVLATSQKTHISHNLGLGTPEYRQAKGGVQEIRLHTTTQGYQTGRPENRAAGSGHL